MMDAQFRAIAAQQGAAALGEVLMQRGPLPASLHTPDLVLLPPVTVVFFCPLSFPFLVLPLSLLVLLVVSR